MVVEALFREQEPLLALVDLPQVLPLDGVQLRTQSLHDRLVDGALDAVELRLEGGEPRDMLVERLSERIGSRGDSCGDRVAQAALQ
eukprot:6930306-Pyramimonas_sp.AAC.1